MPHLIVEYSDHVGLEPQTLLPALHRILADSGIFAAADIKLRACDYPHYLVAGNTGQGFVHLTLLLLDGRSTETKTALSRTLAAAAGQACPPDRTWQVSVDVRDMDRSCYTKHHAG